MLVVCVFAYLLSATFAAFVAFAVFAVFEWPLSPSNALVFSQLVCQQPSNELLTLFLLSQRAFSESTLHA